MTRSVRLWLALGLAWLAGIAAPPRRLAAQQPGIEIRPKAVAAVSILPSANLRVDSNLVLVPVTVCDPMNRPVTGLEKEHFRVLDNKVEQTITHFGMEDEPLAVGLVFDTSGSMGDKLKRSRMAASVFFKISDPDDEFFLVEFDDKPRLVVPLTKDTGTIESELTFSRSHGSTALLDAIYMALQEMHRSKKNKRTLLIISDGGDNNSRYTVKEVKDLIQESDVLIYAIGVFGGGSTPEEAGGPDLLSHIAEQTGGRMFFANPANCATATFWATRPRTSRTTGNTITYR
jgi:VWFA-related protein